MPTFAAAIAPRFVRKRRSSAVPSVVEAGVIAILKHLEKLYTHMPLFTPYFSLDSSAYRVGNGGRLRCHMGAAGIGIYVMLLSHLRDCRDYRAPLDYDLLAFDLHEDADAVRRVVEEFDLFDIDRASGTFTSSALDAVRALGTSDSPSSGRTSTRTGRVRRVRTAAQAYRRSVRRLAADNALPPDAEEDLSDETDSAPAKELGTPPADCATAENDFTTAEEEETPPADAPRSAAEPAPAASENAPSPRTEEKRGEQKKIPHTPIVPFPPSGKGTRVSHSSAPVIEEEEGASVAEVEGAVPTIADPPFIPAEEEQETPPADPRSAETDSAPAASENAPSPRTEEKRGEQKKIPHTPIVPFPPSGKGTRASHSSAPVVEEEEGASEAEVEGAVPTVADTPFTPAENLAAHPDTDASHGETGTTQATTSADDPDTETTHGETDTTQGTTSVAHPDTRTPRGETDTTQVTTSAIHPDTRTPHGKANTTQVTTSAAPADMRTLRGEGDTTQATTSAAHPDTRTPHGETDTAQAITSADAPDTRTPHGETYTTQAALNTETANPAPLDTKPTDDARGADAEDGETFVPPTANEVRRFAQALHHPEFDAEWFVHYYTARHWQRHNGHPVRSWQTTARYWLTHPLQVAQHLLRHRPDPGAAPAGTGAPLGGISPSSAGVSPSSAGSISTTGSTSPSSAGLGAVPAGTRPSSPASGVPLGGSLSLPAPTPLQQSRLCDLRHMVLQLFADTPAAAPAEAPTVPDAPAAVSTPVPSVPTSVLSPRVLSPAEAAHFIEAQTLATDPAEEENRACELSTADIGKGDGNCDELATDAKEGIEAQALPTANSEEEKRAHELSTTDNEKDDGNNDELASDAKGSIEKQAFPTANNKEEKRAHQLSTPDDGKGEPNCDELTGDAEKGIEAQALSTDSAEKENRACELSTTDNEKDDGNNDELASDAEKSIEAQVFPTADNEEENRACELSTADDGKGDGNCDELTADAKESIEAQALGTARSEEENRACELSTADDEEGEPNCDELTGDAEKGIEAQALSTDPAEKENRAHELSTTDNEKDDGNNDELASDAKESIEAQEFPTARHEEENRAHELSTTDKGEDELNGEELATNGEEGIDTQAFSTPDIEEDARTCESDAADIGGGMDTQAISTTKERFSPRSPHGPAPPTDDAHHPTAARHRPLPHATEKHPFPLNLNHDTPPILPLHPPAPVGLGSTLRVQSAQPPFGRALLGRIDLGNAPCPAGSRPLRPQPAEDRRNLAEDRRASPEHIPLGSAHEPKTADFIDNSVADQHPSSPDAPEHPADEPQRRDFAAKRHLDAPAGSTHEPKTADFIDKSVADQPQRRPDTSEHPADEPEHRTDAGKHPADEPPHRPDAGEHPIDGLEHSADQHPASADEFDAGQRLLDTAAHRRAVRAELAACCGALRHLAHCCVAF